MSKISFLKIYQALFEADTISYEALLPDPTSEFQQQKLHKFMKVFCGMELPENATFKGQTFTEATQRSMNEFFVLVNNKLKYYPKQDVAPEVYQAIYIVLNFVSNITSSEEYIVTYSRDEIEYKLMVWFGGESPTETLKSFDKFFVREFSNLEELYSASNEATLHACSDFGKVDYNLDQARNLLNSKTSAIKVLKTFYSMPFLELEYRKIPHDAKTYQEQLFNLLYPNASEDPELADLCFSLNATNFAQIIHGRKVGIIPTQLKAVDFVPEIDIRFQSQSSSYFLTKLPETNPRALQLGNIVGNCQSWGSKEGLGNIDRVVLDGVNRQNNGFYVIVKESKKTPFEKAHLETLETHKHEIVGESPVWIGEDNSIIFGIFAVRSARAANMNVMELMQAFGKEAEQLGFDRIIVGGTGEMRGARGKEELESHKTDFNSAPKEGYNYNYTLY